MKKIVSVVVALLLMVNIFAVSVFAAVPAENAIAITLTSDKTSYVAGETALITISIETKKDVIPNLLVGDIEVSYNDAIFAPAKRVDTDPRPLIGQDDVENNKVGYGCVYGDIINSNIEPTGSFVRPGSGEFLDSDVAAYGWNAGLHFTVAKKASGLSSVDCSTPKTFLTFPIKINSGVADGAYVIGVNKAAFEVTGEAFLAAEGGDIYGGEGENYGLEAEATFACGTCEIVVGENGSGSGSTTTPATVANGDIQVKWADKANGMLNIGFRGIIGNYDHTKDLLTGSTKDLSKLAEVGVVISDTDSTPTRAEIGSTCSEVPTHKIYNFATGEYTFRAIVGNVPAYDNNTEDDIDPSTIVIYANAYIKYDGQYYEATNTVLQTTGATQYADKDMANKS